MQKHTLISVADANDRCDIVCRQTFEITQDHNLALTVGQLRQQLLHARREVLGHDTVVGAVSPGLGGCHPPTRSVEAFVD